MRAVVEQVIQTASKVLEGKLEGQEAVTILATLSRDAAASGEQLRQTDPDRAATYGELLAALIGELRSRSDDSERPDGDNRDAGSHYLAAVADDLAKVRRSLEPS